MDELQASFDRWEASIDALCRYLHDTATSVTGAVTTSSPTTDLTITSKGMSTTSSSDLLYQLNRRGPRPTRRSVSTTSTMMAREGHYLLNTVASLTKLVMANSHISDLDIVSSGMPDPLSPVPNTAKSLVVAPFVPNEINTKAPVFCSTECPSSGATELTHASTSPTAATSPKDTVGVEGAASTATTFLLGIPSRKVSTSVCALSLAAPPHVSLAPTAPIPQEVTVAQSIKLCIALNLNVLVPAKCLTKCIDMGIVNITRRYVFLSYEANKNGVNTNCDDSGEDHRPSWPPPLLALAYVMSELQHEKLQWQP